MALPMRAHLDGIDDPKLQNRLPALNDVIEDIKHRQSMTDHPIVVLSDSLLIGV